MNQASKIGKQTIKKPVTITLHATNDTRPKALNIKNRSITPPITIDGISLKTNFVMWKHSQSCNAAIPINGTINININKKLIMVKPPC